MLPEIYFAEYLKDMFVWSLFMYSIGQFIYNFMKSLEISWNL